MSSLSSKTPAEIASDWQQFVSRAGPGRLRALIVDSWIRSDDAGVKRNRAPLPPRVSGADLEARSRASARMLEAASRHLEWLSAHFSHMAHVAYVTDADGIVLRAFGDPDLRSAFGLDPGYDWSEKTMGTNGAGTALAAGQPVAVIGAEHYVAAFGDCTCTAAPLYSNGRLVGAIDVSSAASDAAPDRLILVAHVAAIIQQELKHADALDRESRYRQLIEQLNAAQKEVEASNDLFKLVTDSLPLLVSYIDANQNYRLANAAYVRWFGEHPVGRRVQDYLGERAYGQAKSQIEAALRGEEQRFEASIEYPLGRRDVVATYIPDRREGRVAGFIALVQDATETKRLQRALEVSVQRRDEFIATLGHELRSPFSAIRNGLRIIERMSGQSEYIAGATELIGRQLAQVQRLLDDLMDLERISRGKIELRVARCDLADALRGAIESCQQAIESKSHRLITELEAGRFEVEGDAGRLVQAFVNLLSNAVKYTEPGGQISLTLQRSDDSAVVKVRDTGVGIPFQALPRIFDMFYQASDDRRTSAGLGIGLALVRQIVELHRGTIEVHSAGPGLGTEFTVRLPLLPA